MAAQTTESAKHPNRDLTDTEIQNRYEDCLSLIARQFLADQGLAVGAAGLDDMGSDWVLPAAPLPGDAAQ